MLRIPFFYFCIVFVFLMSSLMLQLQKQYKRTKTNTEVKKVVVLQACRTTFILSIVELKIGRSMVKWLSELVNKTQTQQ